MFTLAATRSRVRALAAIGALAALAAAMPAVGRTQTMAQVHRALIGSDSPSGEGEESPREAIRRRRYAEAPLVRAGVPLNSPVAGAASALPVRLPAQPPALDLGRSLFIAGDPALDRDRDGLADSLEFVLANEFRPYFKFDDEEGDGKLPGEPRVLFQVRPVACAGEGCAKPWTVWIAYSFLFRRDKGYGRSSPPGCEGNAGHAGDNDRLRLRLFSDDGQTWRVTRVENSHAQKRDQAAFIWPGGPARWWPADGGRHVAIYFSAGKHHQFFDEDYDAIRSPYSGGVCSDDVNGEHPDSTLAVLQSPYADRRPPNVGEPEAHDERYFVGSLAPYGFFERRGGLRCLVVDYDNDPACRGQPEHAWGGDFLNTGTAMSDLWMRNLFWRGAGFGCAYTAGVPRGVRTRVTVTAVALRRRATAAGASTAHEAIATDPGPFTVSLTVNGQARRFPTAGTGVPVAVGALVPLPGEVGWVIETGGACADVRVSAQVTRPGGTFATALDLLLSSATERGEREATMVLNATRSVQGGVATVPAFDVTLRIHAVALTPGQ